MARESEDVRARLVIDDRGSQRGATVMAQSVDGKVYIRYDDEEIEHCVDLSSATYRWL